MAESDLHALCASGGGAYILRPLEEAAGDGGLQVLPSFEGAPRRTSPRRRVVREAEGGGTEKDGR